MRLGSLATAFFFGCMLYADIMYEMAKTTTTTSDLIPGTAVNARVFIKGDAARVEETIVDPDSSEHVSIMIYRFDRGVVWTLDMDNSQYAETVLADTVERSDRSTRSDTLSVVPHITVAQTGVTKDILGRTCEEVTVSIVQISDSMSTEVTRDLWVTQNLEGFEELISFHHKREEMGITPAGDVEILDRATCSRLSDHMKGMEGFPLESHELVTMRRDGMEISLEIRCQYTKLDDKPITQMVFEIPPGFTLHE
jgi:hypothetical protein